MPAQFLSRKHHFFLPFAVAAFVLMLSMSTTTFAQGNSGGNSGGNSSKLSISTPTTMDFGKFVRPESGRAVVRVDKDGNLNARNTQLLVSNGVGASTTIRIKTKKKEYLHISFNYNGNVPNMRLGRFFGTYTIADPPKTANFIARRSGFSIAFDKNKKTQIDIKYGAHLAVNSNVLADYHEPSYTISADYE